MERNNILVLGGNGQLGTELKDYYNSYTHLFDIYFPTHQELDATNFDQLYEFVINHGIKIIINCAAYTKVDKAEELYLNGNTNEVSINEIQALVDLLKADSEVKLIQISTDYAEGNIKCSQPLNYYGETKLLAERKLIKYIDPNYFRIIRISGLFSKYGDNFVKTIFNKLSNNELVKVTGSIKTNLTYAPDLVEFIQTIIESFNTLTSLPVLVEFANPGLLSWYQVAKFIATILEKQDYVSRDDSYQSLAVRPTETKFYNLDETLKLFDFSNLPAGLTRVYELVTGYLNKQL